MTTNGSAMVVANGPALASARAAERADLSVRFSDEQKRVILDTCCGGASEPEARALVAIAEARGLNPILGECYFVKRWDNETRGWKWAVQASIDSFRIKAEQTGLYAGQDEPEYEYDTHGHVTLARVRVWRKDWPRPAVGVARWSEYVQFTKEQKPTKFWRQMPHNQLAKCAEALAMRKAFPAVLSKVYTPEEMAQADNDAAHEVSPGNGAGGQHRHPSGRGASPHGQAGQSPRPEVVDDNQTFAELCQRLDGAETAAAVNAVASAAGKAHKAARITDGNLEALRGAVTRKRALIGAPKPPASEPKVAPQDDGPAYDDTSEAEADAMAGRYDE